MAQEDIGGPMRPLLALALLASTLMTSFVPTAAADPVDCGPGIDPREGTPADAPIVRQSYLFGFEATAYFLDLGIHCGAQFGFMSIDGQPAPQDQVSWGLGRTPDEYKVRFVAYAFPENLAYVTPGLHRIVATVMENCDTDAYGWPIPGPTHCDQQTFGWTYLVAPWAMSHDLASGFNGNWWALNVVGVNGTQAGFHSSSEGATVRVPAPVCECEVARANAHFDNWFGDGVTMDLVPGSPAYLMDPYYGPNGWLVATLQERPQLDANLSTRVHGTLTVAGVPIPFDAPIGADFGLP